MYVYRICFTRFSKKLHASGRSNRWNKNDEFVIYTSESKALAILELRINIGNVYPKEHFSLIKIEIPDNDIVEVDLKSLPSGWKSIFNLSIPQAIGSKWYSSNSHLVLKVPSVVVNDAYNYVINTNNPYFKMKVKIIEREVFAWDNRLFDET